MKRPPKHNGVVSVLAVVFLAMFAALGVAYAAAANNSMLQAANLAHVQDAQLQAESGLEYFTYLLAQVRVPKGLSDQSLLDAVEADLTAPLNAEISTDQDDKGFSGMLAVNGSTVTLTVCGRGGAVQRAISLDFALAPARSAVFDFGVASMGNIRMTGNASLLGANGPEDANVFTSTDATDETYKITGNCVVDGDIYASNPDGYATLTGNVTVGGESIWGGEILDHVHMGEDDQELPELDPTVFERFATNPVDADTDTSGNKTFSNIRILSAVNPNFSGNINLEGVIFVETPNQVIFTGNLNITGVVVTEDAGDGAYDTNTIKFSGNTTVLGVEQLPDESHYTALKQMPGTFLLAPGFGVEFTGNFGTVSGTMAADEFKFSGNAGGTVEGSLLCYSEAELGLTGNASITFDRPSTPTNPPGFSAPETLVPVPTTYREH